MGARLEDVSIQYLDHPRHASPRLLPILPPSGGCPTDLQRPQRDARVYRRPPEPSLRNSGAGSKHFPVGRRAARKAQPSRLGGEARRGHSRQEVSRGSDRRRLGEGFHHSRRSEVMKFFPRLARLSGLGLLIAVILVAFGITIGA